MTCNSLKNFIPHFPTIPTVSGGVLQPHPGPHRHPRRGVPPYFRAPQDPGPDPRHQRAEDPVAEECQGSLNIVIFYIFFFLCLILIHTNYSDQRAEDPVAEECQGSLNICFFFRFFVPFNSHCHTKYKMISLLL